MYPYSKKKGIYKCFLEYLFWPAKIQGTVDEDISENVGFALINLSILNDGNKLVFSLIIH